MGYRKNPVVLSEKQGFNTTAQTSTAVKKRLSIHTVVLSPRVNDHTHDFHDSSTVLRTFFLIKTTGKPMR